MSLLLYGLMASRMSSAARQAASAASTARTAATASDIAARRIENLEDRIDRLSLLVLALAETLKARTGAADEEILKQVNLLDLRDGVADGRMAAAAKKCGKCSRTMAVHHERCLYCGGEALSDAPPGSVESILR